MKTLAIIGGGASAVILLANLAKAEAVYDRIDVYDRRGAFARGVAYGTGCDAHLLNVRASGLSAFADAMDDFAIFAARFGIAPDDFAPRTMYARYLDEKMADAMRLLPVHFIQADVLSVRKEGEGYALDLGADRMVYDEAVLASGNVRALGVVVEKHVTGYLADPWSVAAIAEIPKDGTIAIIGSGLSAVDAIVSLEKSGFRGKIAVVSRKGLFPATHAAPCKRASFLTAADHGKSPSSLMRLIRREIADHPDVPWQAVIDSLRHDTNAIWTAWSGEHRRIFLRRALTIWNIHRHRMPPVSARLIAHLRDEGRLEVVKDRALRVEAPATLLCGNRKIVADAVINALGYAYDEGRPFEVGHRIGPAAFGPLFETTAIPEIRAQAAEIAARL